MSFTDRFIKVIVLTYNDDEADLLNKTPEDSGLIECVRYINPLRLESFGEVIPKSDFRENNKVWTKVTMQSSDDFIVNMPLKEFQKLINEHQKQ